jgi:hypothetical protein
MNKPQITEHQVQHAEELVRWTREERLRFLWYRIRLTVREMNYAARRMTNCRCASYNEFAERAATH